MKQKSLKPKEFHQLDSNLKQEIKIDLIILIRAPGGVPFDDDADNDSVKEWQFNNYCYYLVNR